MKTSDDVPDDGENYRRAPSVVSCLIPVPKHMKNTKPWLFEFLPPNPTLFIHTKHTAFSAMFQTHCNWFLKNPTKYSVLFCFRTRRPFDGVQSRCWNDKWKTISWKHFSLFFHFIIRYFTPFFTPMTIFLGFHVSLWRVFNWWHGSLKPEINTFSSPMTGYLIEFFQKQDFFIFFKSGSVDWLWHLLFSTNLLFKFFFYRNHPNISIVKRKICGRSRKTSPT